MIGERIARKGVAATGCTFHPSCTNRTSTDRKSSTPCLGRDELEEDSTFKVDIRPIPQARDGRHALGGERQYELFDVVADERDLIGVRERATGVEPATSSLGSLLGPCGASVFWRR
jgi:hypothetical protein